MLLTITYAGPDATDLGYLLFKHPARVRTVAVSAGEAHVFFPEATAERCTAALLLEVDPVALVRGRRRGGSGFALGEYVNDRPYASSSMLAVAIDAAFGTAMTGRCDARPDLAANPIELGIALTAVPARGEPGLARRLFEPLGWRLDEAAIPLDGSMPEWGDSRYADLRLTGMLRLADALRQLYVLLPVLDDAKHYWVNDDEVAKLVRAGGSWLPAHPERDLISRRYLAHQRDMVADAAARLAELDDLPAEAQDPMPEEGVEGSVEEGVEKPTTRDPTSVAAVAAAAARPEPPLAALRAEAVLAALLEVGAHRVVDIGCGEGALLRRLVAAPSFTEIVGTDVSPRALRTAEQRLHLADSSDARRERVRLIQSSVTYRDDRIAGFDAAVLMEVVEHVDPDRLPALEASVFGHAAPTAVVVTTPNAEHNVRYPGLGAGYRHPDHRFEWTRQQFGAWARSVGDRTGYDVQLRGVGAADARVGPPTQLALFSRAAPR